MFRHQTFPLTLDWRGPERSILRRKVASSYRSLREPPCTTLTATSFTNPGSSQTELLFFNRFSGMRISVHGAEIPQAHLAGLRSVATHFPAGDLNDADQ